MRIAEVAKEKRSLFVRLGYWFARRKLGQVPDSLKVMGHSGSISFAAGMFEMGLERATLVDKKLKGLAEIKTATLVGCPF